MSDLWALILSLAAGTLVIRLAGYKFARWFPQSGPFVAGLNALPGTLIAALLAVILVQESLNEWTAAALALAVSVITRSLPLTMLIGVATVWFLRHNSFL